MTAAEQLRIRQGIAPDTRYDILRTAWLVATDQEKDVFARYAPAVASILSAPAGDKAKAFTNVITAWRDVDVRTRKTIRRKATVLAAWLREADGATA